MNKISFPSLIVALLTTVTMFSPARLWAQTDDPAAGTVPLDRRSSPSRPRPPLELDVLPTVQLALLLDTSSSMSGLIEQAKTQLWQVVNEFIGAQHQGKTPVVQVALYEYGNNGLSDQADWIRQSQSLTRDLDAISRELFTLKSATRNGSNEYCGAVLMECTRALDWSASPEIYKAIFIAGNESFSQGPVSPADACKAAISKGIIVNTIYCGTQSRGVAEGWKEGALRADGEFLTIDHNQSIAHVDAPQDAAIVELNRRLNDTYIAYGATGRAYQNNQIAQDSNAAGIAQGNLIDRARTKASANYFNAAWDIVDAYKADTLKLEELDKATLPEALRQLSDEELRAHVEKKLTERTQIQGQIMEVTKERDRFVDEARRQQGTDQTLGKAIAEAVRKQAGQKGVQFEGEDLQ